MVPPDGALVSRLLPPKDEELLFVFLVKKRKGGARAVLKKINKIKVFWM